MESVPSQLHGYLDCFPSDSRQPTRFCNRADIFTNNILFALFGSSDREAKQTSTTGRPKDSFVLAHI